MCCSISTASAQSQRWDWCNGNNDALPDLVISGCTAVIQSGKEGAKELAVAFHNRGNAFRIKLEYDRAIKDYDQAIKLDPKDNDLYVDRGWAYHQKGDFDRAIEDTARRRSGLDPDNERAFVHARRGLAAQRRLRPRDQGQ